ncbi:MAG: EamA family transporter [Armatimonadetes bacterium]|nr:EamA family transporter [Armatimonadota bacterium]NCO90282.1 EamA family transporter [Armatimonadota bacterium]NCP30375.1 EamA family transporter [Armatimonadota bacterium]NCQ27757.1 EamA family transporter [Armatimonadota bacterium]NDK11514.1 EamA family transporter [Armatimonadota bacterium]
MPVVKQLLGNPLCLILAAVSLGAVGQLLLKTGMDAARAVAGDSTLDLLRHGFLQPRVLGGFLLYGVSSVLWMLVLSKQQLSFAYPMIAVGYVVVVFLSWLLLKEEVGLLRVSGLALICLGVALVARS